MSEQSESQSGYIPGKLIDAIYAVSAVFGAYCVFGGCYIWLNGFPRSSTATHAVGLIIMGSFLFLYGNYSYHFNPRRWKDE